MSPRADPLTLTPPVSPPRLGIMSDPGGEVSTATVPPSVRHRTPRRPPTYLPCPVVSPRVRKGPPCARTPTHTDAPARTCRRPACTHPCTRPRPYAYARTHVRREGGGGAHHNRTPANARGGTLCPRRMSCTSSDVKCLRIKGKGVYGDVIPQGGQEGGGRRSPTVLHDHYGPALHRDPPEHVGHAPASQTMRPSASVTW